MSPKRALVTGGAGFIGRYVVEELARAGHRVRLFLLPSEPDSAPPGVERVRGDIRCARALRAAAEGCEWVFHLAALYTLWTPRPALLGEVNVAGTRNVLEAASAAGARRIVYTSSIAVFGGQGPGRDATEQSPYRLGPTGDPYAQSKFEAHQVALELARDGAPIVLVAPTGPLGPGDRGPTGRLLLTALEWPVALVPRSEINVGDVRDMASGHLLAAERGVVGECYLLGQHNVAIADLARRVLELAGQRKRVLELPGQVLRGPAALTLAWTRAWGLPPLWTPAAVRIIELGLRADCSRAVRELGLPGRPLDDTLRDILSWAGYLPSARIPRGD